MIVTDGDAQERVKKTQEGGCKMKKVKVLYSGGESRNRMDGSRLACVDFMLAEVDDVELYAEAIPHDDDEVGTYEELKAAILAQAAEKGIDASVLEFYYD